MNNSINTKRISQVEIVFKIWFYLYVILSTCNLTYGKEIISICMWPMLLLGAGLVLYRLIHIKEYIHMPNLWILILFFASYLFSMVTNLQYESKRGLVTMVFWVLYFGILYTFRENDSQERVRKEFELMAAVHIFYALVMTLISLGMMVVGYSSSYIDKNNGNYEVCSGFHDGRLWGAFQDPNLGAIVCCTAIVLCMYFIWKRKEKLWKAVLAVFILLFLLYIAFSDSRNGLVSIGTGMAAYAFLRGFYKERRLKKQWINLAAAVLVGVVCFFIPEGIKYTYNYAVEQEQQAQQTEQAKSAQSQNSTGQKSGSTSSSSSQKKSQSAASQKKGTSGNSTSGSSSTSGRSTSGSSSGTSGSSTSGTSKKTTAAPVKRNYSLEGDISNRRFDLWKSAVEVALSRPLTGTSFPGIVPYAKENLPDTYIVNNDHWDYSTMDNEVLNVFVSQGFPGLLILAVLAATVLKYIFSRIWKLDKAGFHRALILMTCIIMLTASSMFQATMFYQNSTDANMFWMFLGYLIFMLKDNPGKSDKKEQVKI